MIDDATTSANLIPSGNAGKRPATETRFESHDLIPLNGVGVLVASDSVFALPESSRSGKNPSPLPPTDPLLCPDCRQELDDHNWNEHGIFCRVQLDLPLPARGARLNLRYTS